MIVPPEDRKMTPLERVQSLLARSLALPDVLPPDDDDESTMDRTPEEQLRDLKEAAERAKRERR
jgi:hypothetical protein